MTEKKKKDNNKWSHIWEMWCHVVWCGPKVWRGPFLLERRIELIRAHICILGWVRLGVSGSDSGSANWDTDENGNEHEHEHEHEIHLLHLIN